MRQFFTKQFWVGTLLGAVLVLPFLAYSQAQPISSTTLTKIYQGFFHRSVDTGANGYVGQDTDFVLDELLKSQEQTQYTSVFLATKALENLIRSNPFPDNTARKNYYDSLTNALNSVEVWAGGKSLTERPLPTTTPPPPPSNSEVVSARTASFRFPLQVPDPAFLNSYDAATNSYMVRSFVIDIRCPLAGPYKITAFHFKIEGDAASKLTSIDISGYEGVSTISNGILTFTLNNLYTTPKNCGGSMTGAGGQVYAHFSQSPGSSLFLNPTDDRTADLFEQRQDVAQNDPAYNRWERILITKRCSDSGCTNP